MDAPEIKKYSFWDFIKDNPLIYYPIVVIIIIAITSIIFDLGPLAEEGLRMSWWIAIGAQWIGLVRNHRERKIISLKMDKDLLKSYAELATLTGESIVNFLVPYHGKFISRMWNKMSNRTVLSLYAPKRLDSLHSFTKFYATKREMFELHLKGCINTDDVELALKGLQCLSKGKKMKKIL